MIFAISMDYTVFLLFRQRALGPYGRRREGSDGRSMASTGRVIFAAGAVMVAVFTTFALSGPLPPKEMGVILGVAVLLDTALVRLLILPVLLRLLGKWAWYLPKPLGRMLPQFASATHDARTPRHVHPYQGGEAMSTKVVVNLATGMEDPERVMIAFLVGQAAAAKGKPVSRCSSP